MNNNRNKKKKETKTRKTLQNIQYSIFRLYLEQYHTSYEYGVERIFV